MLVRPVCIVRGYRRPSDILSSNVLQLVLLPTSEASARGPPQAKNSEYKRVHGALAMHKPLEAIWQ